MDTSYIVVVLLGYAGYELFKAISTKRPQSQGEALAEALGIRVTALEERVRNLEKKQYAETKTEAAKAEA